MKKAKTKIPFKSKLEDFDISTTKGILSRNNAFNKLSNKDKRKEMAYEGLQLVINGSVGAARGDYWSEPLVEIKAETPDQFQEELVRNLPKCEVCQRGLMMLAQIRLGNTISSDDSSRVDGDKNSIKGFTLGSFSYMESVYEGFSQSLYEDTPYEYHTEEKLANICCNVIANGDFVREDLTDYLRKWNIKLKSNATKK